MMSEDERRPLVGSMKGSGNYNSVGPTLDKSAHTATMNGNGHTKMNGAGSNESQYKGSVVSFHNLFYEVNVSAGCCRKKPQTIINDVSGIFKPGTMNAIMGPTGSESHHYSIYWLQGKIHAD